MFEMQALGRKNNAKGGGMLNKSKPGGKEAKPSMASEAKAARIAAAAATNKATATTKSPGGGGDEEDDRRDDDEEEEDELEEEPAIARRDVDWRKQGAPAKAGGANKFRIGKRPRPESDFLRPPPRPEPAPLPPAPSEPLRNAGPTWLSGGARQQPPACRRCRPPSATGAAAERACGLWQRAGWLWWRRPCLP